MLFWILCICLFLFGSCSKDILWPKDTEATKGSDVVLSCISPPEPSFEWHHLPYGSLSTEISHKDGACLNGYCARDYSVLNKTTGDYSLHIAKVSIDDAGNHRCAVSGEQRGAELNILVSYPSKESCSSQFPTDGVIGHNQCQFEPDRIKLSCELRYVGNLKAYLEWIQIAGSDVDFYVTNETLNGTTTATLQLKDGQLRDAIFACLISYHSSELKSSFNCSFSIKTIPLRPRYVTANSERHTQQINCGSGLPFICSYSWIHEGIEVSSSQTLNLTGAKNGKYICRATCSVRGKSCTFMSYEVAYQQNATDRVIDNHSELSQAEVNKIGMTVGIVVVVVLVAGAGVVIFLKKRRLACFSETSAIREQEEDQGGGPAAEKSVSLRRPDEHKGEEGDKLLKVNVDGPLCLDDHTNGRVLRCDDQNEVNMADIKNASSDYNIQLRETYKISTNDIGNATAHEEFTNIDCRAETDKIESMV